MVWGDKLNAQKFTAEHVTDHVCHQVSFELQERVPQLFLQQPKTFDSDLLSMSSH